MPMRAVAVLFQDFGEADEKVRTYREKLEGTCDIRDFSGKAELEAQLNQLFASWWALLQPVG
jgi:hypothetical protein